MDDLGGEFNKNILRYKANKNHYRISKDCP